MKDILNQVQTHMKQNKISKTRLHQESGYGYSNVCQLFNHNTKIQLDTFIRLLDTLDLEIEIKKKRVEFNEKHFIDYKYSDNHRVN